LGRHGIRRGQIRNPLRQDLGKGYGSGCESQYIRGSSNIWQIRVKGNK